MALRERTKRKHMEAAAALLPRDGAQPLDYALAAGSRMAPQLLSAAVIGGWLVVTVVLSLLLHTAVIIGAIPVLVVFFALKQPRGVIVTNHGIGLLRTSFWNGRPDATIGLDGAAALNQVLRRQGGYTQVQVANNPVWLKETDRRRLQPLAG